jgi:hypothetical protein
VLPQADTTAGEIAGRAAGILAPVSCIPTLGTWVIRGAEAAAAMRACGLLLQGLQSHCLLPQHSMSRLQRQGQAPQAGQVGHHSDTCIHIFNLVVGSWQCCGALGMSQCFTLVLHIFGKMLLHPCATTGAAGAVPPVTAGL